jgi:DNA-binding NarL/FixJ family response regulator
MSAVQLMLVGGMPLLRAGVLAALSSDPLLRCVAQEDDVRRGAVRAQHLRAAVAVLLSDTPSADAEFFLAPVDDGQTGDAPKMLVLTDNTSREELLATLRLGVQGYGMLNALTPEGLREAVHAVAQWESWLCPQATRALMATAVQFALLEGPVGLAGTLSEREIDVLRLAAAGKSENYIAAALSLSRNSVKTYLRRTCLKLGVRARGDAIRLAVQRGLIPDRREMHVVA